jgi:Brp/Blh family beta-carotene 15,15'-monooxygenase
MQIVLFLVRWGRNDGRVACLEAVETGVICLSFLFLHPLFAIGLYVLCWHSWRHLYSLSRFLPSAKSDGSGKDLIGAICRLHIESLPLLIPTIVAYVALAWWRLDVWSSEELAALTIALFVVVTLPHHLLVERLFRYGHRHPAGAGGDQGLTAAGAVSRPVHPIGRDLPSRCSN